MGLWLQRIESRDVLKKYYDASLEADQKEQAEKQRKEAEAQQKQQQGGGGKK